jgi:hypothetical protein
MYHEIVKIWNVDDGHLLYIYIVTVPDDDIFRLKVVTVCLLKT